MKPPSFLIRLGQVLERWAHGSEPAPEAVATLGRRNPKALRAFMIRELAATADGLQGLEKDASRRLISLAKRLRSFDDEALVQASPELFSELAQARRLLQRLQLGTRPSNELVDEWAGWQELKQHDPEDAAKPYKVERMELVRSELSVRGLWPHKPERRTLVSREVVTAVVEEQPLPEVEVLATNPLPDLFDEWLEERAACGDDHLETWQEAFRSVLRDARHDPMLSVAILKHQRLLHGEQKRHDRSAGVRRYRLKAFE
jgi:hypothetical protein